MAHIDAKNLLSLAKKSASKAGGSQYLQPHSKVILKDYHYSPLLYSLKNNRYCDFSSLVFTTSKGMTNIFNATGVVGIAFVDFGLPSIVSDRPRYDYIEKCYTFAGCTVVYKNTHRKVGYECRFQVGSFWDKNGLKIDVEILSKEGTKEPLRDNVILPIGGMALLNMDNGPVIFINNRGLEPLLKRSKGNAVTTQGFGIKGFGIEKKK